MYNILLRCLRRRSYELIHCLKLLITVNVLILVRINTFQPSGYKTIRLGINVYSLKTFLFF